MKKRIYENNRQYGRKAFSEAVKDFKIRIIKDILLILLFLIVGIAVGVIVSIALKDHIVPAVIVNCLIVPVVVRLCIPAFYNIYVSSIMIKGYRLSTGGYREFMKLFDPILKNLPEEDKKRAADTFDKHADSYNADRIALIKELEKFTNKKTAKPLTVGVIAGLIFSCGVPEDRELIKKTVLKKGSAARFIYKGFYETEDSEGKPYDAETVRKEFIQYWKEFGR